DYEEPSDVGSPEVIIYGYSRLPMHPVDPYVEAALQATEQAPPSPDYVSGPEHPPSPDFVSGPKYPKYLVDVKVPVASPAALSSGYITDSDPEEDPADYPADGGDDANDESPNDDDDEEEEQEASEDDHKEEEEHPALADSSGVPVDDLVPSAEDTEGYKSSCYSEARCSRALCALDEDRLTAHIQHEYDRFRDLVGDTEAGPQDGQRMLKMPPKKRTARKTTTTTPMTDAQLKALISQGVVDALAERDVDRSKNGDDNQDSGSDGRRRMPVAQECTYSDFLKCQPLNFKGIEGVVGLP
nr:hypothetical protein [Tanacetum cinerariifolium]